VSYCTYRTPFRPRKFSCRDATRGRSGSDKTFETVEGSTQETLDDEAERRPPGGWFNGVKP